MVKNVTLEQVNQNLNRLGGRFEELTDFIKDQVAMKSEVQDVKTELRSEIRGVHTGLRFEIQAVQNNVQTLQNDVLTVRHEVLTVADQVTKLQETVEIELVAPTRRVDRLERRVTAVERKLGLAT